jgi:hypothetical protein
MIDFLIFFGLLILSLILFVIAGILMVISGYELEGCNASKIQNVYNCSIALLAVSAVLIILMVVFYMEYGK